MSRIYKMDIKTSETKILILIGFLLIVLSCNRNTKMIETEEPLCLSPNSHFTQEVNWIKKIVYYGDTLAYQTMFSYYYDDFRVDVLLGYSIIMANKYDYPQAYYDVFDILTLLPHINSEECKHNFEFYCLDNKTQQMALTFFREAIYKGNIYASERLLNEFDKGKPFAIKELYSDKKLMDKAKQNAIKPQ